MNGINSAEEQRNGGIRILCTVCHKKLKQNLKFDSIARFTKLAETCEQLGFPDEAAVYRKLIADCAESGIVARAPKATQADSSSAIRGLSGQRAAAGAANNNRRSNSQRPANNRTTSARLVGKEKTVVKPKVVARKTPAAGKEGVMSALAAVKQLGDDLAALE